MRIFSRSIELVELTEPELMAPELIEFGKFCKFIPSYPFDPAQLAPVEYSFGSHRTSS